MIIIIIIIIVIIIIIITIIIITTTTTIIIIVCRSAQQIDIASQSVRMRIDMQTDNRKCAHKCAPTQGQIVGK